MKISTVVLVVGIMAAAGLGAYILFRKPGGGTVVQQAGAGTMEQAGSLAGGIGSGIGSALEGLADMFGTFDWS